MTPKLLVDLNPLLHHRHIESERVKYKAGWNSKAVLHSICVFANDFYSLGATLQKNLECFSLLDKFFLAQRQKTPSFNARKEDLVQGLFPSVDEAIR